MELLLSELTTQIGHLFGSRHGTMADQAARSGVCLVRPNTMILLVVQAEKATFSSSNPEPQIIAEAIAAFQHNN